MKAFLWPSNFVSVKLFSLKWNYLNENAEFIDDFLMLSRKETWDGKNSQLIFDDNGIADG